MSVNDCLRIDIKLILKICKKIILQTLQHPPPPYMFAFLSIISSIVYSSPSCLDAHHIIQRFSVAYKTPAWSSIHNSFRFALRLYTRSQNVNNHHEEIIPRLLKKYVCILKTVDEEADVLLHRWDDDENGEEKIE